MKMEVLKDYGFFVLVDTEIGEVFAVKHGGKPYLPPDLLFQIAKNEAYRLEMFLYEGYFDYGKYQKSGKPVASISNRITITPREIKLDKMLSEAVDNELPCFPTKFYLPITNKQMVIVESCGKLYALNEYSYYGLKTFEPIERRGNLVIAKDDVATSIISIRNVDNPEKIIAVERNEKDNEGRDVAVSEDLYATNFGRYVLFKVYDEDSDVVAFIKKTLDPDPNKGVIAKLLSDGRVVR